VALASGTRLGPYEVTALIGAGGMGEVYRARDTKLNRDVALKILSEAFTLDSDRIARFRREAQMLALLNHPNIAAIYGFEDSGSTHAHALVLELVEGPTLFDRIGKGPIPIDEALAIAKQIAQALEAAHEQGIIHRDLKPANVKIRDDGTVKVLDFGLAKLAEPAAIPGAVLDVSAAPTITTPAMTMAGVILGTAAYMSPEQAKGTPADKRSDIWAFGCVLYEMLTGKRAFAGEDTSDTIASVLKSEPEWSRVPSGVPPSVLVLMQRCLTKDRRQRVPEVSTVRFLLTEHPQLSAPAPRAEGEERSPRSALRLGLAIAGASLLGGLVVGAAAWAWRPTQRQMDVVRFSMTLPEGQRLGATYPSVAISSDGTTLAYAANGRIFVRSLKELDPQEVAGSAYSGIGGGAPMFAPDGQSIAFFSGGGVTGANAGVTLSRIPIGGGAATNLSRVDYPYGGSWAPDGILIGQGPGGIVRVPMNGGASQRVVNVAPDEVAMEPQILPDGRTLLFTLAKAGEEFDRPKLIAQSPDGTRRVLRERASGGRYANGHLWYLVSGTTFAAPFDAVRLTVTGDPVSVLSGVLRSVLGVSALAVSATGTAVYRPGPVTASSDSRRLVVADMRDDPKPLNVSPAPFQHPRASPDGRTIAVSRSDGAMSDVWLYDLAGTTEIRRLTFDGTNRFPVWSADGAHVTFQSARGADRAIWWESSRGGPAERLTKPAADEEHVPESWSRDGRRLLFSVVKNARTTLWVFTLDSKKIERFGSAESSEPFEANFSPDGRWVVYAADSGTAGFLSINRGVYIEPFPPTGERYQAPKQGLDYHPVWAPDGKALFYISTLGSPLVSVPVVLQSSVAFGTPTALVRGPRPGARGNETRGFDILPDGRFISLAPAESEPVARPSELRVMFNWSEELKQRVPVK
jgi:serine/threonine-protein kinase